VCDRLLVVPANAYLPVPLRDFLVPEGIPRQCANTGRVSVLQVLPASRLQTIAMGKIVRVGQPLPRNYGTAQMSAARLRGREAELFGVRPAVMLGQDLAGLTGLVRHGAVADLAAHDRKLRDGHREAAGT
jgi:hypothetical protein